MSNSKKVYTFDSTLRDGAQARGITYSLADKLHMVKLLDELGVDFIEAGNPISNPKEREFFEKVKDVTLNRSKLVAFGSTRRKNMDPADDVGVNALLNSGAPCVAIFGKSWDLHVTDVIRTTLEENLAMVESTIKYLKTKGREVFFDAEHFFDGYKANEKYALQVVAAACRGGADAVVLCDTNGGALPGEVEAATKKAIKAAGDVPVGIHCHNDSELAVANTITSVIAGARQVQGTLLGFGERCGNARLSSIIPTLQLKLGFDCIPAEKMASLTEICKKAADISNILFDEKLPYVGDDAFAHKGGMHIDGIKKSAGSFEHIDPTVVGNNRDFLLSEVAGGSAMSIKLMEEFPEVANNKAQVRKLMDKIKELENEGYSFEGAEGSFKLLVLKELGLYKPMFSLVHYRISDELSVGSGYHAYAVVKVNVNGQDKMSAAEGNGPVNALDKALRLALGEFYPELFEVSLSDYKVRVIDTGEATAAKVRVAIESFDGNEHWTTLGVSTDIIEASLVALSDSIEYKLHNAYKEK